MVSAVLYANYLRDALVLITLSRRAPAKRGLLPPMRSTHSLVIQAHAFAGYPQERYWEGFQAVIPAVRRNETSPLSYIESCNYVDSVLARMKAHRRLAGVRVFQQPVPRLAWIAGHPFSRMQRAGRCDEENGAGSGARLADRVQRAGGLPG